MRSPAPRAVAGQVVFSALRSAQVASLRHLAAVEARRAWRCCLCCRAKASASLILDLASVSSSSIGFPLVFSSTAGSAVVRVLLVFG
ncbi:hypothetical protein CNX65_04570 [Actinosynnema pretiosum]|uniref:Uncharacterized protein n=1 Tax=Actinosynnema pretiosum TaxID=42197 RepID=A0A290Z0X3_9PSEU|nr:hypothetical protein CNX65_04570 [Actinosynnema pretiosum]